MTSATILLLAQAAPAQPQPNVFISMMPLIFIFIIFYFLLIRPQQKKAKEHAKLVESIKTGDQVVTNAGIHGVVANVKEKTLIIKIADNVKVEFDRAAVAAVEKPATSTATVVREKDMAFEVIQKKSNIEKLGPKSQPLLPNKDSASA